MENEHAQIWNSYSENGLVDAQAFMLQGWKVVTTDEITYVMQKTAVFDKLILPISRLDYHHRFTALEAMQSIGGCFTRIPLLYGSVMSRMPVTSA